MFTSNINSLFTFVWRISIRCVNNNVNDFVIYSEYADVSDDSLVRIGEEVKINTANVLEKIPPFRPNSRLKIKIKERNSGEEKL